MNARRVKLELFPGESMEPDTGTTIGHIYAYVDDNLVVSYAAAAGPPPGAGHPDHGGHSAEETPAGSYVLGAAERHTSDNWPYSVVPWGAMLRERERIVEYSVDGKTWRRA